MLRGKQKDFFSIPSIGSPFSSQTFVCGHTVVTVPDTAKEFKKIFKRLSSLPILIQYHSGGKNVE